MGKCISRTPAPAGADMGLTMDDLMAEVAEARADAKAAAAQGGSPSPADSQGWLVSNPIRRNGAHKLSIVPEVDEDSASTACLETLSGCPSLGEGSGRGESGRSSLRLVKHSDRHVRTLLNRAKMEDVLVEEDLTDD
eukprot:TRINITY_DN103870_c0_g1_i1.p1 TRINITY_DN103870_c0_g1~~TRINITY_DN103870_c0_g1_i1.p1  ORF type:complete len:137 (-),score=21.15 TRINITY_DN103870_c0_g1_i1:209-619(-)